MNQSPHAAAPHPRVSGPPGPTVSYPVAGLDRRFYAFALDRALGWAWYALVGLLAWWLLTDGWLVGGVVVGVVALTTVGRAVLLGVGGTSPGKSAVGLRVVHHGTGTPVGVGRALLRTVVLAVASLPTFGLGLASLAWTAVEDRGRQRRGWHDHLAHSVVVDVRPVPEVHDVPEQEAPRQIVNLTAMRLVPAPALPPEPVPPRAPEHSVRRQVLPGARPAPAAPAPAAAAAHAPPPSSPAPAPAVPAVDSPVERTVVRGAPTVAPGPRWRVTLDSGEGFVVEGVALLGRRPEPRPGETVRHLVPLSSADMSVSKTHAQLAPAEDGVLVVTDRGSTNGSLLVRRGVTRRLTAGRPATLLDGDRVTLGDREITISREP